MDTTANNGMLFLSFWNLCLDNLPLGEFSHRCMTPHEARLVIEQARKDHRLVCVSQDDLIAPYHQRERESHQALCIAVRAHFGIGLSVEDFFSKTRESDDSFYTVMPLNCVQVK